MADFFNTQKSETPTKTMKNAWLLYVLAHALVANVLAKYLIKKATAAHSRTMRIALQFFFCFLLASCLSFASGTNLVLQPFLLIGALGFLNGIAAYFQWRAINISVSKTALYTFWDDVIAMTLSYAVLREGQWLNGFSAAGIALSIFSVIAFARIDYRERGEVRTSPIALYGYITTYSVIWGGALFAMKYCGMSGITFTSFAPSWYGGAFVSTALGMFLYRETTALPDARFSLKDIMQTAALSAVIVLSLGLAYLSYQHAPQIVVQPLMLVGEMTLSALVGLWWFQETRQFNTRKKRLLFLSALVGGLLVAVSY